jgi:PEP-CTERM motif
MRETPVAARTFLTVQALIVLACASQASANLGSFAPADGYSLSVYSGGYNWCDVAYYNAGAYGPNSGGGPGPTLQAPYTGNWNILSQAGGMLPTAALRAATIGSAPPYPTSNPSGVPVYLVGDHSPGRTDNSSLAFRNDMPAGSVGPALYDYTFDTYDSGGPVPSSVTTGIVSFDIFFATSPNSPNNTGGPPLDRFTQSFRDSSGNIGAQWGYGVDNTIMWRANPSGPWNYTSYVANAGLWDGMSVSIDLTNDTFALNYYDVVANTTYNLAPAGTPLGTPMANFAGLRWQLEDGTNGGVGGKNFFDDAKLTIPAPSALALLGVGALAAARRRR